MESSLVLDPPERDSEPVPNPIDYSSQPLRERLKSKVWEARSSAYEDMLASTDRALIFDSISSLPNAFIDEITIRGQESALRCLAHWSRGLVSVGGAPETLVLNGVIAKYSISTQPRIKDLVMDIFRIVAERFGVLKSCSFAIRLLSSCVSSLIGAKKGVESQTRPIAKGTQFRQICGCLHILTDLKRIHGDACVVDSALGLCKELLESSVIDKQVRESATSFLQFLGEDVFNPAVSQENEPPTNRSLILSGRRLGRNSQKVISNSLDSLYPEEESRSTAASPEIAVPLKSFLTKEWMEIVEKAPRWQDRRDAWATLSSILSQDSSAVIPEEVVQILLRTIKTESNVPISVEAIACASRVVSRASFVAVIQRIKDKNGPVQKAVFASIITMTSDFARKTKMLLDAKLFENELKPLSFIARREIMSLIAQLLPLPGLEASVLEHVVAPALADSSDIPVRDMAIQTTKIILADASSRDDSVLAECINCIRSALHQVSSARRKVIEEALGMNLVKSDDSLPRPRTATISVTSAREKTRRPLTASARRATDPLKFQLEKLLPESLVKDMLSNDQTTLVAVLTTPSNSWPADLGQQLSKWLLRIIEKWRENLNVVIACTEFIEKNFPSNEKFVANILPLIFDKTGFLVGEDHSSLLLPAMHSLISKTVRFETAVRLLLTLVKPKKPHKPSSACLDLIVLLSASQPRAKKELLVRSVLNDSGDDRARSAVKELARRDLELNRLFLLALKAESKDPAKVSLYKSLVRASADQYPQSIALRAALKDENPEKVTSSCLAIQQMIDDSETQPAAESITALKQVTETVFSCLQSVLTCSNSPIRQSVLTLLHNLTRAGFLWQQIMKPTLKKFLRELLSCVNDKKLRSLEPEIWADLNLSLVHAIANSHRPTAYLVLFELITSDTSLASLAIKCVEKLNRSLPQYLNETESNLNALLLAFKSFFRDSLTTADGEEALVQNECMQGCLQIICNLAGIVEVGEFVGLHVESARERAVWKRLLKSYADRRRKSIE